MSSYKSRKPSLNQRSIASFFGATPKQTEPICLDTPKKPPKSQSSPNILAKEQQQSRLNKLSQPRGAFDEFGSSDTSFGSPEVTNFRNPLLARMSSSLGLPEQRKVVQKEEVLFVADVSDDEKENLRPAQLEVTPALKRAASSNIFDILDGQPRKVAKRLGKSTSSVVSVPVVPVTSGSVTLSEEQKSIVDAVVNRGENLFFTGSAGTGKSVVLRHLVQELFRKHGPFYVGVTASTGLAACNIKGQTLHKFLSIGLGTGSPQDLAIRIKRNGMAKKRWLLLKVLVIDEILMIDGVLFSKIDEIAKIIRNDRRPFGGIQIVCSGDFFQLPPVSRDNASQYCFQSSSWKSAMRHTIILNKVFRQKGDTDLIDMLNALREGNLSQQMVSMFQELLREVHYSDGIGPTELFPTRQEVKRANDSRLMRLSGPMRVYTAHDSANDPDSKRMFANLMCEERLELKVGAQVMYLKNSVDTNVVNGSIGTVECFIAEELFVKIFAQFHPTDFINASPEFVSVLQLLSGLIGQSEYTLEQKQIFDSIPESWKSKVAKLAFDSFTTAPTSELLPVVKFNTNNETTIILVRREEFTVDQSRMKTSQNMPMESATREQLPLLLAWAMSIHKAQGQSIERLRVDLRRTFENGHIYVALSRATNKKYLEVLNFNPKEVKVSEDVRKFYKTLSASAISR